jgi:hypothetical protein
MHLIFQRRNGKDAQCVKARRSGEELRQYATALFTAALMMSREQ